MTKKQQTKYPAAELSRVAAALLSATSTTAQSDCHVMVDHLSNANVVQAECSKLQPPTTSVVSAARSFSLPEMPPEQWTSKLEKRFATLAKMRALGELESTHVAEFEKLRGFRRALVTAADPEQVELRLRQRATERKMLEALESYVQFHRWKDRSRPSPQEHPAG